MENDALPQKTRKGPSLAALAALVTLALSLWLEVELSSALLRAVLVYLGLSLITMTYRVILGHYLAASEERAREELFERIQKEAEAELSKDGGEKKSPGKRESHTASGLEIQKPVRSPGEAVSSGEKKSKAQKKVKEAAEV